MAAISDFSHLDDRGRASMVDVSKKEVSRREAVASCRVLLSAATVRRLSELPKGDAVAVARVAGIQAAKQTGTLIPLCHPLPLGKIDVDVKADKAGVTASSEVVCVGQTGVEMEALTAVSVALLTVYDMCKAVDKEMTIEGITLVEKTKHDL